MNDDEFKKCLKHHKLRMLALFLIGFKVFGMFFVYDSCSEMEDRI